MGVFLRTLFLAVDPAHTLIIEEKPRSDSLEGFSIINNSTYHHHKSTYRVFRLALPKSFRCSLFVVFKAIEFALRLPEYSSWYPPCRQRQIEPNYRAFFLPNSWDEIIHSFANRAEKLSYILNEISSAPDMLAVISQWKGPDALKEFKSHILQKQT